MGGDLNSKKSWHPHTIKNQKRVWQAEKANAVEKQKFQELQHEISSERARDELISMGKASGVLKDNSGCNRSADSIIDNKKLEWMYKSPAELLNREEYLLGRSIDRNFEEHAASEKQQKQLIGVTVPKNHVEHECIPFSIRSFRGYQVSEEQVDLQRKMMEDPLMAIKQKEIETRRKILENPVKLKELHRLLHNEKDLNQLKSKKKSKKEKADRVDKKSSKRKHHKSKHRSNSTDADNHIADDLDVLIAKKYQNLKTSLSNLDTDNKSLNLGELLNKKYNTLTTELDNVRYLNRNKKKRKKTSKDSDDDSDSQDKSDRKRTSCNSKNHNTYSNSNESKRYSNRDNSMNRQHTRESSSKRSVSPQEKRSQVKSNHRKTSMTNSSDDDDDNDNDSDNSGNNLKHKKSYGLVSADGKKLELKNVHDRHHTSSTSTFSNRKPSVQWKRPERKQLSEEEKKQHFKEMQQNVEWRDLEREKTIRKYREEQHQTDINEKLHNEKFDKDFLNKELHKALSSQNSVESRIKSKINNIQRSGYSMDSNFAKR